MACPVAKNTEKLHQFQSWSFPKLSDTFSKVLLGFILSPSHPKSLTTEYHLNCTSLRSV